MAKRRKLFIPCLELLEDRLMPSGMNVLDCGQGGYGDHLRAIALTRTGTLPEPSLCVGDVTVREGNDGVCYASFEVQLNRRSTQTISVSYQTADSSATAGNDYQATRGILTFEAGQTKKTVKVAVLGNQFNEATENFLLKLADPVNAALLQSEGTGTILDNDPPPRLSFSDISVAENGDTATVTVNLSQASDQTIRVAYGTSDRSATVGIDYQAAAGTLVFKPGETTKTIDIGIVDDEFFEREESFALLLHHAVNAKLGGDSSALVSIADNEVVPATAVRINFSKQGSPIPDGYLADSGAAFGDRGNGLNYGWNADNSQYTRDRDSERSPDERYDSLQLMQGEFNPNGVWELALKNGTYTVHLVAGDPTNLNSVYKLNVEEIMAVDGSPTKFNRWLEGTVTVEVTDGRLTISNADGAINNKINFIDVISVNDAPLAGDDSYTVNEDDVLHVPSLGVLGNDSDVEGDLLSAELVIGPAHGTLTLNPDGSFTYAPAANFFGTDHFTYQAQDGSLASPAATVTLTVDPVNDTPLAGDDSYTVNEDDVLHVLSLGVLGNDSDVEGDLLSAELVTGPAHGTLTLNPDGSFTYAPAANFFGTDHFTYQAKDGSLVSPAATVTLTVDPVNDAPLAGDDSYTVNEDDVLHVLSLGVLGNDSDVEGDLLSAELVTGPAHGTLTLNPDGSFTYAPAANFFGTDHFTYQAQDGSLASPAATVTITVDQVIPPGLDFSQGFVSAEALTLNSAARINGSRLQLTGGSAFQAGSAFSDDTIDVTSFTTEFTFQMTSAIADGMTFTIQGKSPTAVGPNGGYLGYGDGGPTSITKSVAVTFDLWNNAGEGPSGTGLYTNGEAPFGKPVNLVSAGIDFHSGHVFAVAMSYDGVTLQVTIRDTVTQASATQHYAVDIPTVVGGSTAYVGFTAATGSQTATQEILTWTFQPREE